MVLPLGNKCCDSGKEGFPRLLSERGKAPRPPSMAPSMLAHYFVSQGLPSGEKGRMFYKRIYASHKMLFCTSGLA